MENRFEKFAKKCGKAKLTELVQNSIGRSDDHYFGVEFALLVLYGEDELADFRTVLEVCETQNVVGPSLDKLSVELSAKMKRGETPSRMVSIWLRYEMAPKDDQTEAEANERSYQVCGKIASEEDASVLLQNYRDIVEFVKVHVYGDK